MKSAKWIRSHTELWAHWRERPSSPAVMCPLRLPKNGESRALSSPTARAAIVACTLGSMFPDIDIFAGPLAHNPLAIMEWHRNITHSAVMLPIWALLLAAVSIPLARWVKWKSPPFPTLFAIYAVGIATHIFLDLVTNFGTMVWSPLRYSRPAWDWIFILDLTLTSIALVPAVCRVVLPGTGTILAPRHWRRGPRSPSEHSERTYWQATWDTDFRLRL